MQTYEYTSLISLYEKLYNYDNWEAKIKKILLKNKWKKILHGKNNAIKSKYNW